MRLRDSNGNVGGIMVGSKKSMGPIREESKSEDSIDSARPKDKNAKP